MAVCSHSGGLAILSVRSSCADRGASSLAIPGRPEGMLFIQGNLSKCYYITDLLTISALAPDQAIVLEVNVMGRLACPMFVRRADLVFSLSVKI